MSYEDKITALTDAAARVTTADSGVESEVTALETALSGLSIDYDVWITDGLYYGSNRWHLGYAQVVENAGPQLALRHVNENNRVGDAVALLSANKVERILSMARFSELLDAIINVANTAAPPPPPEE